MRLNEIVSDHLSSLQVTLNLFQESLLDSYQNSLDNGLIIAPTGIGKTLGASMLIFSDLFDFIASNPGSKSPLAIWITPLKALSRNLMQQLENFWNSIFTKENPSSNIKRVVTDRTGDTSQAERRQITTKNPFILCTTPESLFSMVVQKGTRIYLSQVKYVIVDELHSLAESKRGVLLTLTLELLERISKHHNLIRIGLSATVGNPEWLSKFLVGPKRNIQIFREQRFEKTPILEIINSAHNKTNTLPITGYSGGWLAESIAKEISMDRTILVFTKTRSSAELMAFRLKNIVSEDLKLRIGVHHSSLSQEERFLVENGLKHGYYKCVCCTASLELGIDIGHIDEVMLLSSPPGTNNALQRIGRARHKPDEISKSKLFVVNFFDLLVSIALKRQIIAKKLSPVTPIEKPYEVLAQAIFGMALQKPFTKRELQSLLDNTLLFTDLTKEELDQILEYCMQGGQSLAAYEDYKRIIKIGDQYEINPNARQFKKLFYQNIGTIIEEDMLPVFSERGRKIGALEESIASSLAINDLVSIGGKTYRLTGYRNGHLVVKRDKGQPTIPRWGKTRLSLLPEVFDSLSLLFENVHQQYPTMELEPWLDQKTVNNLLYVYDTQIKSAPWPTPSCVQIEFYDLNAISRKYKLIDSLKASHPFLVILYTFAGYKQNQTLARLIAYRLQKWGIHQVRIHADEVAFGLFSYKEFPLDSNIWNHELLKLANLDEDLKTILENSNALRIAFRETAVIGQMVLRTYYKMKKTGKQLRLSHDLLFDVLMKYEPDHTLLEAARMQVSKQFLHIPDTVSWLNDFHSKNKNIHVVHLDKNLPILSLPVIAHGWIDWSVPDDPEDLLLDISNKILRIDS